MEVLSFDEINDWKTFEDLVADYFKAVKQDSEFDIDDVEVQQTGSGSDGGRDILIKITVDDSIMTYKRIWVVQCKFRKDDIKKSHLADINIPTLLHQYGADGYLLVCKNHVTSGVSLMFEGLTLNCAFKRKYAFWNGSSLLRRIRLKVNLIEHYFPKHYAYLKKKEQQVDEILKQNK